MLIKDNFENKIDTSFWSLKRIEKANLSLSENIKREGNYSLKIEIKPGDKKEGNTERAEISEHPSKYISLDTDVSYSFSVFFPEDFYISSNRFVFCQLKQKNFPSSSPFISLRYSEGMFNFQVQSNGIKKNFKKEIDLRGKWTNFKLDYKLESNGMGYAYLWINDIEYIKYTGEMGYKSENDYAYFKMGIYRDKLDIPQVLYFDNFSRELILTC